MIETKFKQTEIGLIPEDWEIKPLDDFIQDIAEGPFGSNLKLEHYTLEKEARIIQLGNISENGWNDSNVKYTTFNHANEIHRCIVTPGEIVIAKMMPAGRAIKCPNKEKMYVLSSDAVRLTPNDIIDPDYLLASINFTSFRKQISEKTQGSTRARTNIPKLRESVLPLPKTIKEQYFIAQALSDIDALIVSLDNLISKKKVIKQGAMQQLLTGKIRLQGYSIPWEIKKLGEVANIYRGGSPRPISEYITNDANGVSWIKIGDVSTDSKYITHTEEKIKLAGVCCSREVHKGDFILSNSMSYGRPYILAIDGCIHDGWLVIKNYSETFDKEFLYYYLSSQYVMNQYRAMAAGSSVKNLNKDKVAEVITHIPTEIAEQHAIAKVLSDIDDEILHLELKIKKYISIKQGMMQQLLTGKIRLI